MFLHYEHTVAAIVLWFRESFFFFFLRLFNPFVYLTGIVAKVLFIYLFNIDVS